MDLWILIEHSAKKGWRVARSPRSKPYVDIGLHRTKLTVKRYVRYLEATGKAYDQSIVAVTAIPLLIPDSEERSLDELAEEYKHLRQLVSVT